MRRKVKLAILYPSPRNHLLLFVFLSLAGFALIRYSTVWGAGLMDDAAIYITAGKNLAAGNGLVYPEGNGQLVPLTYFPPLFSFTLAGFERVGVDAVEAARLVNALAFGASVFIVGRLAKKASRSGWASILAGLLFLSSDVLLEVHSWAMSEPLYLFLCLGGLLLFSVYLERQRLGWLLLSAVAIGLAFLTRYLGASLILAVTAALIFHPGLPWRQKLSAAAVFGGISLLPMAGWMARTYLVIGSPTNRSPGWYLVTSKQLQKAFHTILNWFIPSQLVNWQEILVFALLAAGVGLIAGAVVVSSRRPGLFASWDLSAGEFFSPIRLLLVFQVVFHVALLLVSKSFFDPITPLNDRILSPILPSLLILISAVTADLWRMKTPAIRTAVLILTLLLVLGYMARGAYLVTRMHQVGLGFARKGWHRSQTIRAVRALDPVPIYTNSPWGIYMWTGRTAYSIVDLPGFRRSAQEDQAVLVLFNSISLDLFDVSRSELTQDLTLVHRYKDGAIYRLAP